MQQYGLIGYPLTHSFSEQYFAKKFEREALINCNYQLFPLQSLQAFNDLLQAHPNLRGLNVTIPYKVNILDLVDDLDETAQAIGAVNTLCIGKRITGYNTDVHGFKHALLPLLSLAQNKALVLGNGGAAKAVCYAFRQLGIEYTVVSRQASAAVLSYDDLSPSIMQSHLLIVNCTPLGTYPGVDTCPALAYELLSPNHLLYDLVYNPAQSLFLRKGKAQGASIKNGLEMLELQAEKSWQIWQEQVRF